MCRIILAAMSTFICLNLWAMSMVPNWVYSKGALFEIRLKIVDQDGAAVSNAKVWGGFTTGERSADYTVIEGFTDSYGEFLVKGRCNELLRVDITKDRYYRSELKINFWESKAEPIVVNGKWQPYGETRVVALKKIRNLGRLVVPDMSSRTRIELKIPKLESWIPFDLEKYDWVEPYGEGQCSDVLLRFRSRSSQHWYDYTDCMDICFTNNPYSGAYEMKKDMSSDLHTIYEANPKAEYKTFFAFKSEQTSDRKKTNDYLKDDSYFVYRIRTKVDEEGKLLSAHYGIIMGTWMSAKDRMIISDGCFNAESNDVNVEDCYYLRQEVRHYKDSL